MQKLEGGNALAEKTGAIVTLEIDVTAEYTCSACGKENRLPDSARVTGSTASILALKKVGKGRDILPLLPGGLNNAGLQCRCGCGHREAWSKLRDPLADKIQKISLWALAVFAAAAYLLHTGEGPLTAALLVLMALAAAALCAVTAWKRLRRLSAEKQLKALPPSAIPKVYLR